MRCCWVLGLAITACGRGRFDLVADSADATGDAGIDANLGAWGTPVALTGLNTPVDDSDPAISDDGLELFFHSLRSGGAGAFDLYRSVRASTSDTFTTAIPITELNTAGDDLGPTTSADGLTIFFSDGQDLVFATRASRGAPFGARQALPALSSADSDTAPGFSGDGRIAVVVRGSSDARELWMYTRAADGPPNAGWSAGALVDELNSSVTESSPELDAQGLTIYFHSNRVNGVDDDIFVASRRSTSVPFDPPTVAVGVSSSSDDGDPTLTADQRTIVFHRNLELMMATR